MFAGTTVVVALLALAVAGIPLVTSLGYSSAVAVVTADVASGTDPIASYVPLMMFAVLFGLSMDYQVFLLSQVDSTARRARATTTLCARVLP